MTGKLFIVCAPSGAGKTSLVAALLKADPLIKLSISCTTRPPRPGEVDGRDYHFISKQKFDEMMSAGAFLESACVHDNFYGTSQAWINEQRAAGADMLLEIDWQGAAQVRKLVTDAIGIFIMPPALDTLLERLTGRAQDPPEVITRRLSAAKAEISHFVEFDYVIINDNFAEAVQDLVSIVRAERLRVAAQVARHREQFNRML